MYKTIMKNKGQLPYGSLITKKICELNIEIPRELSKVQLPPLKIDEQMMRKMSFRHIA